MTRVEESDQFICLQDRNYLCIDLTVSDGGGFEVQ